MFQIINSRDVVLNFQYITSSICDTFFPPPPHPHHATRISASFHLNKGAIERTLSSHQFIKLRMLSSLLFLSLFLYLHLFLLCFFSFLLSFFHPHLPPLPPLPPPASSSSSSSSSPSSSSSRRNGIMAFETRVHVRNSPALQPTSIQAPTPQFFNSEEEAINSPSTCRGLRVRSGRVERLQCNFHMLRTGGKIWES